LNLFQGIRFVYLPELVHDFILAKLIKQNSKARTTNSDLRLNNRNSAIDALRLNPDGICLQEEFKQIGEPLFVDRIMFAIVPLLPLKPFGDHLLAGMSILHTRQQEKSRQVGEGVHAGRTTHTILPLQSFKLHEGHPPAGKTT
jgi:hypothetical protein